MRQGSNKGHGTVSGYGKILYVNVIRPSASRRKRIWTQIYVDKNNNQIHELKACKLTRLNMKEQNQSLGTFNESMYILSIY